MRLKSTLVVLAAACAAAFISVPAASAAVGPNPDTRDAAAAAQAVAAFAGPSPDARDAAISAARTSPTRTDLRSPDTRDAANGVRVGSVPEIQVISQRRSSPFQWGDAGIGAGTAMVFVVLAAGALVAVHRRQRSRSQSSPSALPSV